MKKMRFSIGALLVAATLNVGMVGAVAAVGATQEACTPQEAKFVEQVGLTAAQTTCIFESEISDAQALATFCRIEPQLVPSLLPLVNQLIGQREGAKKAGVRFHLAKPDGG